MAGRSLATQLIVIFLIWYQKPLRVNSQVQLNCLAREGLTPEEGLVFQSANQNLIQNNPRLQCVYACWLENLNHINGCTVKYEQVNRDAAMTGDMKVVFALKACEALLRGKNRCECGYQLYNCMKDFFPAPKY